MEFKIQPDKTKKQQIMEQAETKQQENKQKETEQDEMSPLRARGQIQ